VLRSIIYKYCMVYGVITRSLHIQLQVASELSSTFSWCMVMHHFVNLVCHWEHLRTWIFYLDVVGSDIDSNMIFVGRTMQVVRAYKNAEHAEVQFTVSSWDFLNSITSRWISLNCFVNWVFTILKYWGIVLHPGSIVQKRGSKGFVSLCAGWSYTYWW
jgi:hypothetical protein